MNKFKVGDKVRIINNDTGGHHPIGSIGEIIEDVGYGYDVAVGGVDWNYVADSLKLVTPFTKHDLQDGDVVITRNRGEGVVDNGRVGYLMDISSMNDDMINANDYLGSFNYDVMKVVRDGEVVYERNETPKDIIMPKGLVDAANDLSEQVEEREQFIPDKAQETYYKEYYEKFYPEIKEVLFVRDKEGAKSIVKLHDGRVGCVILQDDDEHDYNVGVLMAFIKALRKTPKTVGYGYVYGSGYFTETGIQ